MYGHENVAHESVDAEEEAERAVEREGQDRHFGKLQVLSVPEHAVVEDYHLDVPRGLRGWGVGGLGQTKVKQQNKCNLVHILFASHIARSESHLLYFNWTGWGGGVETETLAPAWFLLHVICAVTY